MSRPENFANFANGPPIHGFHNSTVKLKTRDYSKFSCLFTYEFARESD